MVYRLQISVHGCSDKMATSSIAAIAQSFQLSTNQHCRRGIFITLLDGKPARDVTIQNFKSWPVTDHETEESKILMRCCTSYHIALY